jgi:thioredoxin-like negative regulator of GroEL
MRYFRTGIRIAGLMAWVLVLATALLAQDQQLRLNPHLDYNSDSVDGPLITGNDTETGVVQGKPNYVMIYSEGCFNSKRQARRTVTLSERYKDKVNFVIIDLDKPQSPAQLKLVETYYGGAIPDLVVLDSNGRPVYNRAGEQSEEVLSHILDTALQQTTQGIEQERH